ncbi:MAG TPA: polysaccharide biosynthesis tyrosine autokinase, partial [Candidatus Sulfomarinibacteraceae bacterium]|nr:polysaccharide biosynthesis tyrosine autokinase [Candidatus Sulfomarinibacteraceae bacterium]
IDLMEYVRLVWARKWLVVGVLLSVVVFATAWSMTRPKLYRATTKITLQPPPQLSNNQFDLAMNWWQMDRIIADQVQILKTRALAQRVVDRLGLASHPAFIGGDATGAILGSISAEPIEGTFVVEVSMTGRDPAAISEWLNIYIEEYTAANIEDSIERTRRVYDVIQSRLDPLRVKVSESEQQLMRFREREDAVLLADQDKNVITEQVTTLTTEYAQAKAERIRLETKLNALSNMRAANISETSFPEVLQDETVKNLVQQRNDFQGRLTEKLRSLREGHPEIQDLRARIANLDQQILDQVEAIKQSIQTDFDIVSRRERSLYNNIQSLREQTIDLSKQTLELERLERDYNQNKAFLEEMLARSNEADIASTKTLNNVRVIEPALPPGGPFRPNPPRTIALASVLGLFLGIGLVVGLDFLDHTLRSPDQVERYVGLETLTVLPKMTKDNEHALREAFQSLRTALMLAARGDDCHVVMVSSAVPEEGKTTTIYNLAKALAAAGSKVLLIDADLRKPRLHRMIQAKNVRGLTSVVLGERTASEVIHHVPDVPNLDLITSGPLPPNPPELFGKHSFGRLLEEARAVYDWVLIDTPPVAMVTDPVICASSAELSLLVVQYGSTRRQVVREAVRLLGRTGTHVAGAVLNKVEIDRDPYYYGGYYAYTRYGYYGDSAVSKSGAHKATKSAEKTG